MKITAILAVAMGLAPLAASADEPFRCGKWIVTSSMTVSELGAKCGAPTSQDKKVEDVRTRNLNGGMTKVGETITETWTYERGSHAAAMVVTIVDGRIKSIDGKR
ncbi:MAG: DUF2845 domain-containing protein [Pseudomonadota bacterium]